MGFKDLFIEREPEEPTPVFVPETTMPVEEVYAQVPDDSTTDFIGDCYEQNNLADFSKSIFKVEELAGTLPAEMPETTKKQTVLSIMTTVGLSVEDVLNDGLLRIQTLEAAKNGIVDSLLNDIQESEDTIESLKLKIEELQKDISMKKAQENSIKEVEQNERNRINSLINFLQEDAK